MNKLNIKAFGLACGIVWSAGVMFMSLLDMVTSWPQPFVSFLTPMYIGYEATLLGTLIGGIWGFIDGFIGGWLLAWLYNKFLK